MIEKPQCLVEAAILVSRTSWRNDLHVCLNTVDNTVFRVDFGTDKASLITMVMIIMNTELMSSLFTILISTIVIILVNRMFRIPYFHIFFYSNES